jgi:AraC-like DNA-binding protein
MASSRLRCREFLPNDGRVRVLRELDQVPCEKHCHEFFEIVLVCSGTGIHVGGTFRDRIHGGDVLIINSRRAHSYEDTRQLHLVNVLAREDVMDRIGREFAHDSNYRVLFNPTVRRWRNPAATERLQLSGEDLRQMNEWVVRMEEECASGAAGSTFIAESYLVLMISVLLRNRRSTARKPKRDKSSIARLLGWVDRNLHLPLSVADLAREAGMSERSFFREFRKVMHSSPSDYLLHCRLERAAELLRERPNPRRIGEIAEACGFEDSNYFSTCFRRWKGCAPSAYRNQRRSG